METKTMEDIQMWIDGASTAQLLFRGETLAAMNACARKLLPVCRVGDEAQAVLGSDAAEFWDCGGDLLFSAEIAGRNMDARVTDFQGYRLVELLENMDAMSSSALRSVAESLARPMTTVMSLTPKLLPQLEETSDPKNMERAAQVNQGLYALHRAISNIRFAAGEEQLKIHPKRVNMTGWLSELAEQLGVMCEMVGRKLTVDIPGKTHMCDMDGELMERAILNVVSNAMKFTEQDGEVRLSLQKVGGRIRITVRDDGCGIPSYQMATVFCQKEHREMIPDPRQGIGLGLPMVRRILQAHGGTVMLESKEDKGTSVHMMLPASQGKENLSLSTTILRPDYSGGFNKFLLELSDVLPSRAFDTRGIDL